MCWAGGSSAEQPEQHRVAGAVGSRLGLLAEDAVVSVKEWGTTGKMGGARGKGGRKL